MTLSIIIIQHYKVRNFLFDIPNFIIHVQMIRGIMTY